MTRTTEMNQAYCANCGEPVSRRGPTPASGRRYCMKPQCQDAKYRARDEERRPAHRNEWAPTECSTCGTKLAPRRKRRNDSPAGRWCQKVACQEERKRIEATYDVDRLRLERDVFQSDSDFLRLMLTKSGELEPCPQCGGRGLAPWLHPNAASPNRPCAELGDRPISRATATLISPAFRQMVESTQS